MGYSWDNPQHWERNFLEFSTLEIPDRQNEESKHKGQRDRKNSLLDFYRPGKDLPQRVERRAWTFQVGSLLTSLNSLSTYFHRACENATLQKVSLEGGLCLTQKNVVLMAETFSMCDCHCCYFNFKACWCIAVCGSVQGGREREEMVSVQMLLSAESPVSPHGQARDLSQH